MKKKDIDAIVESVANQFRTFGSGKGGNNNPIAQWAKDEPHMFAGGVDVRQVVECVVKEVEKAQRKGAKSE